MDMTPGREGRGAEGTLLCPVVDECGGVLGRGVALWRLGGWSRASESVQVLWYLCPMRWFRRC